VPGPQLITYADRFAGDLAGLRRLLDTALAGAFDGVHVLPFYVAIDGVDAGFDPSDHRTVDPRVGTWHDVASIAESHTVMADVIVNHVSSQSPEYEDWVAHGRASAYDGMFLTLGRVFPHGATEDDLGRIHRPRRGFPVTRVRTGDGEVRAVWTTFTPEQIDLDVEHPVTEAYLDEVLRMLSSNGVTMVRLDAVGYAIKRPGTSCFMLPEVHDLVARLSRRCHELGMTVLLEIHGHHDDQVAIAREVDLVYDFALPPLVLDALYRGDASLLRRWLAIRPANAVNVLDTHDGIGVIDVGPDPRDPSRAGLLDAAHMTWLAEEIVRRSGGTAIVRRTGPAALDVYQVDCTFADALGGDEHRYLLARLVQLVVPGIAQVYYVGLLAGHNDVELTARTGVPRDINRHHYDTAELETALVQPVVRRLLALLRWRRGHPAFDGSAEVLDAPAHVLRIRWRAPGAGQDVTVDVTVDLAGATFEVAETFDGHTRRWTSFDRVPAR
jgi:sucrose phosphorylase